MPIPPADGAIAGHLTKDQVRIALLVGAISILIGLVQFGLTWRLDANGFSIVGKRLPYWDFSNLWGGSRLVLQGGIASLFDVEAYRQGLDELFGTTLPAQEWSYPPSMLLIGVPLALLPIPLAYVLWSVGTLFVWHLAVRPFRLPAAAHLFVVLSPATLSSLLFGQNGALTAALLIGGLVAAPKRPILAGVLFGLLTIKPHLGFLVPFCLLASGNYRAIAAATATTGALVLVTGLSFGFDVWLLFWSQTRPLMTLVMEAPYPQAYHTHAITGFVFARSLGLSVEAAWLFQGAIAAMALAGAAWLWRKANPLDPLSKTALTGALAILALPYGYTHDSAPLYLALAWFLLQSERPRPVLTAGLWLFAILFPRFHDLGFSAGFIGPAAIVTLLLWQAAATVKAGPPGPARSGSREAVGL